MTYTTFHSLLSDASEFNDEESFLSECGGSIPSDDIETVKQVASYIFCYGKSRNISDFIKRTETSNIWLSNRYGIPVRTVENWKSGVNSCPRYVSDLIAFAILSEYCEQ